VLYEHVVARARGSQVRKACEPCLHKHVATAQPVSKALLARLPSSQTPLVPPHIDTLRLELVIEAIDKVTI